MRIDIWDLKNGFIQQKIDVEHMYMECPDGYSKVMDDGSPAALHCLRSIYGLRQSSMLLHERLTKHLSRHGFKQQRGRSSTKTCAANSKYHPGPLEKLISSWA
jgi:hypothetical protein